MKYIKLFEGYKYDDEFSYVTKMTEKEISVEYNSNEIGCEDIEWISASAIINWHLEFDHNDRYINNIEVVVDKIYLHLLIERFVDEDSKNTEEETDIELNMTDVEVRIELKIEGDNRFSLEPDELTYEYMKKKATLIVK